ncbi:hypothetical protein NDU88_001028 [Pleurodeles waltl]|uniref:Uncharacterized protein n=1 Tax=Pleurodeles waltl TaxID=8319 RepID=A0AAV7USW0_PLEWA|nr:hypothetical protein NDU88_001028 [Pleurodeles waltl]
MLRVRAFHLLNATELSVPPPEDGATRAPQKWAQDRGCHPGTSEQRSNQGHQGRSGRDLDQNLPKGRLDPNQGTPSRQAKGGNFQMEVVNLIMDLKQEVKDLKRMLSETLTLICSEVKKRA